MENWQTASQQVDLEGNGFYYQLKSSYDQIIFYYDEFIETLQTLEHLIFLKFGRGVFDTVTDSLFNSCFFFSLVPPNLLLSISVKAEMKYFPGGPVVKSLCYQCKGHRFNPRSGN